MSTEPGAPVRASTEDWCERLPNDGHAWTYTIHAGQPRIQTRKCQLCGFLSVEPVRELLRAPAGTGSPTPADDLQAKIDESRELYSEDGVALIGRWPLELAEEYARDGFDNAEAIYNPHGRAALRAIDLLRAELSQVQRERDALQADRDELRAALAKAATHVDTDEATCHNDVAEMVLWDRAATLRASVAAHETARKVSVAAKIERNEARSALAALRAEVDKIAEDMDRWGAPKAWREEDPALADIANYATRLRALVTDQSPAASDELAEARVALAAAHDRLDFMFAQMKSPSQRWSIAAAALRDLPEAVKTAREASQLSLWDVTKTTGVTEIILSRLERREGYPSAPTALKVMDWLAGLSPTSDTQTDGGGS